MKYYSKKPLKKSIRLKGYDYSQPNKYFVTMCTQNRALLFGDIIDGKMVLNEMGRIAQQCWYDIPLHFPHVKLDEFIIMPNHIHGIIVIVERPQRIRKPPKNQSHSLSPEIQSRSLSPEIQSRSLSPEIQSRSLSPVEAWRAVPQLFLSQSSLSQSSLSQSSLSQSSLSQSSLSQSSLSQSSQQVRESLEDKGIRRFGKPIPGSLPTIIGSFKAAVTKQINQLHNTPRAKLWQPNYYEHIIRNKRELNIIRRYIINNPIKWALGHNK